MAYETGTASDCNDLLNKLRVFALAHGWTVDYYGARTTTSGASQGNGLNALALTKAGCSWVLYHATSGGQGGVGPWVLGYMHTGPWAPTSGGTDAQANRSSSTSCNKMIGPFVAYHFFSDPARAYLHVVVEVSAGSYRHFGVGHFDQVGAAAVAAYTYGTAWYFTNLSGFGDNANSRYNAAPWCEAAVTSSFFGTVVRFDSDGTAPRYLLLSGGAGDEGRAFGGFRSQSDGGVNLGYSLMSVAPSYLTGRAPLFPAVVMAARNSSSIQRSIIGQPFDLRLLRIDNLNPGDIVTIGSDQWRTFPIVRKNGPSGVENSGVYGYAYRVVP